MEGKGGGGEKMGHNNIAVFTRNEWPFQVAADRRTHSYPFLPRNLVEIGLLLAANSVSEPFLLRFHITFRSFPLTTLSLHGPWQLGFF